MRLAALPTLKPNPEMPSISPIAADALRRVGFFCIAAVALVASALALSVNHFLLGSDQALVVDIVDAIFRTGAPFTKLGQSVVEAFRTVIVMPADEVCALPLPADQSPGLNAFRWHAYSIAYLVAPLRGLLDGWPILAGVEAFTFVGVIAVVYLAARRHGVSLLAAVGFAFILTVHPAWSQSVYAQFYFDRLFLVFGLLYILAAISYLEGGRSSTWMLIVTAALAAMCTERAGIMICGFTVVSLFLYRGMRYRPGDRLLFAIAAVVGLYTLCYMKFFQMNESYASPGTFLTSIMAKTSALLHGEINLHIVKFLLVNALAFGVLTCFHWRLGMIAAGTMLPNLLISVGGEVEKTGWMTHYHVLYFTFLLAAGLYGLINLHKRYTGRLARISTTVFLFGSGFLLLFVDPFQTVPMLEFSSANVKYYAPLKTIALLTDLAESKGAVEDVRFVRSVAAAVPSGKSVATVDRVIPAMYDSRSGRRVHLYPLGIDTVEYVVVPYEMAAGDVPVLSGAFSAHGSEAQARLNKCMNERLDRQGFRTNLMPRGPGARTGYAVLQRP